MAAYSAVIVTAADEKFWRCLYQFLASARSRGLFARYKIVAYDLGLRPGTRAFLERKFPGCEFRTFPFERHPPHVRVERGTYAWKPIIVSEVADEFDGLILWFDSATIFHADLAGICDEIKRRGVHVLKGFDLLVESCNPLTLQALGAPLDYLYRRTRPAGYVGVDSSQERARRLVRLWREHALIESHISPGLPVKTSHRQRWHKNDQSLLTILLNQMADAGEISLTDDEMDMSSSHPVRWMSSRNKVPPWISATADPAVRAAWCLYKSLDRSYFRLRDLYRAKLRGRYRALGEHFEVFVQREGDAAPVSVSAPPRSYYADPMLWKFKDRLWLFVEELRYGHNRGRICILPLDEKLRAGTPIPILDGYLHASYPFIFEAEGALCLVPETSFDRCVDLYVCEQFPTRWRLKRRIFDDLDAADSTLIRYSSYWWLFTFVRQDSKRENRFLAIYFTDDLFQGEWRPHPVNAEQRYFGSAFNSMRSAGPFMFEGGRLFRPVQINPNYYGQSLQLMEIDELTPSRFSESPVAQPHWTQRFGAAHHISRVENVIAWDIRDRAGPKRWLKNVTPAQLIANPATAPGGNTGRRE